MPSNDKRSGKKAKTKHWLHLKPVHILFSLLVLTILVATTAFFVVSTPIKYGELTEVRSTSGKIKVNVPSAMTKNYIGENIIDYEHRQTDTEILSHIRAETQYVNGAVLKTKRANISAQFKKGKGKFFDAFSRQPLSQNNAQNLSFSTFEPFNNGRLKGLAANFSYGFDSTLVKGRLLISFGDDEIYLLATEATSDIWDENTQIWEEVFKSFEVADGN